MLRHLVWWDGRDYDLPEPRDYTLPTVGVVKFVGCAGDKPVTLAVTAGHTDGHHSHVDIASYVYHIDGESLIPDAGRGKYSKAYFRQTRYDNPFNNASLHNIPRIGGQMQRPGPEFGGRQQYYGTIVEQGERDGRKTAVIDFHTAYNLPELTLARRTLSLDPNTGAAEIRDEFTFSGTPLPIEQSFVTWHDVAVDGDTVTITGERSAITVQADGANFTVESLDQISRENERSGVLKRITTPVNGNIFTLRITPKD